MSNIAPFLSELSKAISGYGEDSLTSATAKPRMALDLIKAAHAGHIDETFAKVSYELWINGQAKAKRRNARVLTGTKEAAERNPRSDASNTSKNLKMIQWGKSDPDAYPHAEYVLDFIETLSASGEHVKDAFQSLYDVGVKVVAAKGQWLDADTLRDTVIKKAKEPDTELQKLQKEYAKLRKMYEGTEENQGIAVLAPVVTAMESALIEYGGEDAIPPVTKEEKKAAEAIAYLRDTGRIAA